jgi:predicted nucleic acid-binding protein
LAFSVILQMIESDMVDLIASTVVAYENSRNPYALRRKWVQKVLGLAAIVRPVDESIKRRALELEQSGLKAIDALHLACAEASEVDYFITCDDRLIHRYERLQTKVTTACDPIEFIRATTGA